VIFFCFVQEEKRQRFQTGKKEEKQERGIKSGEEKKRKVLMRTRRRGY
jgi:hypothetical protein